MQMDEKVGDEPLRFVLIDKSPGSDLKLTCQASCDENRQTWISLTRSLLDMQGDFLRGQLLLSVGVSLNRARQQILYLRRSPLLAP